MFHDTKHVKNNSIFPTVSVSESGDIIVVEIPL
jgi:hypothetical protein